jgi:hypothetical protein
LATFSSHARYQASPEVERADVGDEAVLLCMADGRYYGLNAVARFIWAQLAEPRTPEEMVDAVLAEFRVDRASCAADVSRLLSELLERGLVVRS